MPCLSCGDWNLETTTKSLLLSYKPISVKYEVVPDVQVGFEVFVN